jgi:hypothetical protein
MTEAMRFMAAVPVVPVRSEPRDNAEMVTQILAGESVVIQSHGEKDWVHICCTWDGYEGWADRKQLTSSNGANDEHMSRVAIRLEPWKRVANDLVVHFSMGSQFHGNGKVVILGDWKYERQSLIHGPVHPSSPVKWAEQLLGTPYLWGGRSSFGCDCSGLVQLAFQMTGCCPPRDAAQQYLLGSQVSPAKAEVGDLAFFSNSNGHIVHVGFVLADGQILHAAGEVRIDRLTPAGILREPQGELTHNLAGIKRWAPSDFQKSS